MLLRGSDDAGADAFADGAGVAEAGVQPFGHLALPVGDVGELVPVAGAVLAAWDCDDVAADLDRMQRGLEVGGFGHGDVFVLVAEDLEERRIALCDVGDG